ncbi:MAG: M28 family peptidase, partial [Bacteroidota bacterium]
MRNSCYYFLTIILSIPLFFPQSLSAQSATTRLDRAIASIDYDYFFKHLSYLASDELKGRGIGTQEYDMAARYVADEFRKNGLESFGDAGTYFQQVALSKLSISKRNFSLQFNNESKTIGAEYGSNLSVVLSPAHQEINEEQQVVFVGYGNIVPEQNINDYEGVDVKGKTVIVALGGPKGMSHPSFHDRNEKFKNAVANGASGLILFYPKADLLQNVIFRKVHGFLSKGMLAIADTSMQNPIGNADLRLLFFAKKQLVENIFKLNGLILKQTLQNMAKGTYESKALTSTIQCQYTVKSEPMESKNVMAILPGTDPHLRNEYVVIGAHLDGSGIGKAIKGDSIYNGMMDNASGVSALLSISKAFNKLEVNPKRSIIFACYTAEENGLLGSSYFTN